MNTLKKVLALLLAILGIVGIFTGCESEPEEVYLTTSNLSEYLDVSLELESYSGNSYAEYTLTTKGNADTVYKDVKITYNLNASKWKAYKNETMTIAQDGNTTTEKFGVIRRAGKTGAPDYTIEITAVRGSVLVG